jgi:hypothetical protein
MDVQPSRFYARVSLVTNRVFNYLTGTPWAFGTVSSERWGGQRYLESMLAGLRDYI